MNPWQFTRSVRTLNRLRHIARVLTQHGFGHVVARMDLTRYLPVWMMHRRKRDGRTDVPQSLGKRLTLAATELGPTFVKLGQMLTTRPDLVPADVIDDLRSLQDNVEPFPTELAKAAIEEDLGRPLSECYKSFSDIPLASGSIGQVYRAVLHDGTDVVVKVRRPNIEDVIALDMQLLNWLAESLESFVPEVRAYRPKVIVQEFEQVLSREMDYINEASATHRMHEAFRGREGVRIPEVQWDFCTRRVFTMTALRGQNVEQVLCRKEGDDGVDRRLLARRLANAYLDQIFEFGMFHADPHSGNILVEPPATIGLIDFGQVGTITPDVMTQIVVGVYAAVNREVEVVIDVLGDLRALGTRTDRRELGRSIRTMLDKYHGLPIRYFDIGSILHEFSEVVRHHDVFLPREVIVLIKALGMASAVATRLDPQLDIVALLRPRLEQAIKGRFSRARMARATVLTGWHLFSILRQMPVYLRDGLQRLSSGSWELNVRHENIDRLSNELDRSSNRLSFAVVIAAIIVGSSVVVSANSNLRVFNIEVRYFGMIGYLVAGILGLGLSWAIFRSGRLH